MAVCAALLEPELTNTRVANNGGPLSISLHCAHRIVTFATTPLGLDYMFQKFTRGLPGPGDGARVRMLQSPQLDLREEAKAHESLTAFCRGSWLGRVLTLASKAFAGDHLCHITFMPGVHFIATGIAALPNNYYRVPAVRMLWDLIVYMGVLVLFTKCVLFIEDDGPVEVGEIAFAAFVVVSRNVGTSRVWYRAIRARRVAFLVVKLPVVCPTAAVCFAWLAFKTAMAFTRAIL